MRFDNMPEVDEICQERFPGEEKLTWHECGVLLAKRLERDDESCVSLRRVIFKLGGLEPVARGSATVIRLRQLAPLISWLCNGLAQEASAVNQEDKMELISAFSGLVAALQKHEEWMKNFESR